MIYKRLLPTAAQRHLFLPQLSQALKRNYHTMRPEDYLMNQRSANVIGKIHKSFLHPLKNCNHGEGTGDEIELFGVPKGIDMENPKDQDIWVRAMRRNAPDMVFLQMDPSNFMARQRYLAHKSALNGVEDYDVKATESLLPDRPMSWEETVGNLSTPKPP